MDKIITLDLLKLFKEKYDETLPSILEKVLTAEEEGEEVSYGLELLKSENLNAAEEAGEVTLKLIYAPKVVGEYSENLQNILDGVDWHRDGSKLFLTLLESIEKIEGQSPLLVVRYIFSSSGDDLHPTIIADNTEWDLSSISVTGFEMWDSENNYIVDIVLDVTTFKDWSTLTFSVGQNNDSAQLEF